MEKGKAVIVCAPSGTGKSTIIDSLRERGIDFYFSVSATSRPPRGDEQEGKEYYFKSQEEFERLIAEDAFIEYEEVYSDQKYGTLKSEVEKRIEAGINIIFDVDIHGGLRIKEYLGDRSLSLFILPPSIEALRERLINRKTETLEKIETRLARAKYEISRANEFDRQLVNDDLAKAKDEAYKIVSEFFG